ncbi:MFS transporter [uncultured Chitinophaga sp.]|jgi:drug resistance transporter, EmrB/QacA subfamily|uniref:MFS transporter n=1 Tax=uncultured Chitinophaga sp. TaxID=339340 RepID=UPI0026066EC3|nr:MFS transporter [uncultured Chitinophaga sp.]
MEQTITPATTASPGKWAVLFTVAFGTFMATLDGSIVNIALPTLRKELNAGDNTEWVVLSYLLVTTSTLLIMGRLSDMLGRKGIYIAGFSTFVLGSFLCGLAWDIWSLVGFRVVQGLGASMMFAIGPAIIGDAFQPHERGKALGWLGTIVAAGSSTGPVAGGLLLQYFGWPSIFYVNVPIGLIAIWRATMVLPASPRMARQSFDLIGAALFSIGVTTLLIGIDFGADPDFGWNNRTVILLLVTGVLLLLCFLFWEKRFPAPMLKLSLFSIKAYSSAISASWLGFIANGAHIYVIPFFLQLLLNFSPQEAGLIMLAGPLTLSVAAPVGGYLSDKISTRLLASTGLLITASGYFLFSFIASDWSWHNVIWRSALLSLGFGLFQSPNSSSALNAAPVMMRGTASSLIAFVRNLGMVLGIALGAAVWYTTRNRFAVQHLTDPLSVEAQISGMRMAYRVTSCLVIVAAIISATRGKIVQSTNASK